MPLQTCRIGQKEIPTGGGQGISFQNPEPQIPSKCLVPDIECTGKIALEIVYRLFLRHCSRSRYLEREIELFH